MIANKTLTDNKVSLSNLSFSPISEPAKIEIRGILYSRKSDLPLNLESILEQFTV